MKSKILQTSLFVALCLSATQASVLTPTEAYKTAIENSSKVKASKYRTESKAEEINEIYGRLYPQLEGDVSYSKIDYERNEMAGRTSNPREKETSTDVGFTLSQVIYDPVLLSTLDVEKARTKIIAYDHEIDMQKIAVETLDTYMSVLNIKNKIELLKANLEYVTQNLKMIEEKYALSLVTKMDFLKVQVEYQKSQIDLVKEEKNYEVMFEKLKDITKLEDITIPSINLNSLSDGYLKSIYAIIEKHSNLDKNIEVLQSNTAVLMSKYEVENAKDMHLPDLSLSANYTKYITRDDTTDYKHYGRAMIKLRVPIFSGFSISSKVTSKQLMQKSMEEDLRTIEDEVNIRLNENVNSLKSQLDTLNMYKSALISGETYLQSVQLAYDKGLRSIVELYDAKNKLFEIKYDYIQSIHEMSNLFVGFLTITNNLEELQMIDYIVQGEGKI